VAAHSEFAGDLSFTGEISVRGKFTDGLTTRGERCTAYAHALAPATTLWVVPTPNNAETVAGHIVFYTAGVVAATPSGDYHGPGSYSGANALISELTIDNASFVADAKTSATIIVDSDGAGSLSFRNLVDTSTFALEAGKVTWRCAG
jgi:hypothetical protein